MKMSTGQIHSVLDYKLVFLLVIVIIVSSF